MNDVNDAISRQQAIETFKDCAVNGVGIDGIVDALEQLPPIQPEPHWIQVTKEEMFKAGYDGREIIFKVDGRLFAIRELAQ